MAGAFEPSIRPALPADYPHFARLFRELGAEDPVPSESVWNAVLGPQIIFLEDHTRAIGYGFFETFQSVGYVRHLVVDPAHRRRGSGRKLMEAMAQRLRLAGCATWRLNVRIENAPAQRLYESLGLEPAYRSTAVRMRWDAVKALPASERVLEVHVIHPDDDAILEARFDLPPGQLANHRGREGQVLLRVGERAASADRALGVASFAPSFPGAAPFRVSDRAAIRDLLEAIRPYARPSDEEIGLVIEDDEETVAMLRATGARVRLELFHYRGELPVR